MARPLLSTRVKATLSSLAESAMEDTATIVTPGAPTSNGRGGETPGAATTRTSVCRFLPGAGDEGEPALGELRAAQADARLWLPLASPAVALTATVTVLGLRWQVVYAPPTDALSAYRLLGIKRGQP